jgi:hypothetical protein
VRPSARIKLVNSAQQNLGGGRSGPLTQPKQHPAGRSAKCYVEFHVSLGRVAIERASGSVSEICWSGVASISTLRTSRRRILQLLDEHGSSSEAGGAAPLGERAVGRDEQRKPMISCRRNSTAPMFSGRSDSACRATTRGGAGEACRSRASDRRQHGPRFFRNGLGLDGQGVADPALKEMKSAGGCQTILREGSSPEAETGFPSSGSAGLGERSE